MIVLGLSCGKDASAVVVRDGVRLSYALTERLTRARHASGLCRSVIEEVLARARLTPADIDVCALAVTPGRDISNRDPDYIQINDPNPYTPNSPAAPLPPMTGDITVTIGGHAIRGLKVRASAAHAASSFFCSGYDRAAILVHDAGEGAETGFVFAGEGSSLRPLYQHELALASLYDKAAERIGLGRGAAGKLMGLSAYGRAAFRARATTDNDAIMAELLAQASAQGYDLSPLGRADLLPAPLANDIAASIQKYFSDRMTEEISALRIGYPDFENLCLGGGAALNCPTNARLAAEAGFASLFIPPHCDNSGLSLGAAWIACDTAPKDVARDSAYAMMGPARQNEINDALAASFAQLDIEMCDDAPARAAQDLAQNKIVGWFEGGSEIGPRALGHRSILANPRDKATALRVNALKLRETWRPFAPACLLTHAERWFDGVFPSPFMLMTHQVRDDVRDLIPAVVHADGSSRVQTVTAVDGGLYAIIEKFFVQCGIPMVLNTSFNGANEPIVERPREALAFFLATDLDVLYLDGARLSRK